MEVGQMLPVVANETASEREMVRRFIAESVKYWVK